MADSRLRVELCDTEIEMHEGIISLPSAPGLGISIDDDALRRFSVV
jgi:L-alanine-DL-glutamate epimerase-like enolase superfamily enzyme